MNGRLINEHAFQMARMLLGMVENCLRPEEYHDAFESFFAACKAGIECYELQADRMQRRLKPSRN